MTGTKKGKKKERDKRKTIIQTKSCKGRSGGGWRGGSEWYRGTPQREEGPKIGTPEYNKKRSWKRTIKDKTQFGT